MSLQLEWDLESTMQADGTWLSTATLPMNTAGIKWPDCPVNSFEIVNVGWALYCVRGRTPGEAAAALAALIRMSVGRAGAA